MESTGEANTEGLPERQTSMAARSLLERQFAGRKRSVGLGENGNREKDPRRRDPPRHTWRQRMRGSRIL